MREDKLFAVVTRMVPRWAQGLQESESYAVAVVIENREEAEVRYYTQIRQALRTRVRF